jgi:hypothetical protein
MTLPTPHPPMPVFPSPALRLAAALAAFPAAWAVREATNGGLGGLVVLALIGVAAVGLPPRRAALVVAIGLGCFVVVHLIAALTAIYVGIAVGASAFAALGSSAWRTSPSA